jgi:two-component system phosphate regulon sensor histidine kinase PhoR
VIVGFRTKVFAASLGVAAAALVVATTIIAWELRAEERTAIERRLRDQAMLIAELLAQNPGIAGPAADDEADRLANAIEGRVTLIRGDGVVVGDSSVDGEALAALENHLDRPEVQAARTGGIGVVERYSTTIRADLLYAAAPARHPEIAYVRVALPLTAVAEQARRVGGNALIALALAAPLAVLLAWLSSALLSRRVQAIARVAQRYSAGDLAGPRHDYGSDELGTVARVLDASVQDLGRRVSKSSATRTFRRS